MTQIFYFAATPLASLLAGIIGLALLLFIGAHRDTSGEVSPAKIVACVLLCIVSYTFLVLIVGNFAFHIPVSVAVANFGEDRIAWLMLGLLADTFSRLYRLFDSELP
ncbi:MAG TPA: hypothetical protein VGO49_02240 [Bradyrhizobium sp.]|jgi:hypothetical protein|nr:hypothetical protein [Bradyrhizobium sp.]